MQREYLANLISPYSSATAAKNYIAPSIIFYLPSLLQGLLTGLTVHVPQFTQTTGKWSTSFCIEAVPAET